ncbi:MAG: hypothetical protein R3279_03235 [Putridiphycobacter sp.]|nr:hypothetical protein [Putridiphycobacter sp.]
MKPFLTIEENDEIALPKKYHEINNICAVIYDQLTEIYSDPIYKELQETTVDLDENSNFIEQLNTGEINGLDWLKKNKLNPELEIMLSKNIILAVCSDFINFIFESLYNAKRGKLTVAYALLRKPLTDELLIFEQLLSDRTDFINRFFYQGNPQDYDPSNRDLDKSKIIEKAISKLRLQLFPSAEFIYDLRYNKECEYGINGISNHALHIVTKDRNYKTSNRNLNFVFSQKDDFEKYFAHYYNLVPYLLVYSVSIVDEIVFSILKDEDSQNLRIIKEFKRFIGLILLTEKTSVTTENSNEKLFKEFEKALAFTCPKCNKENAIERADCILFFSTEVFLCASCFENLLSTKEAFKILENALHGVKK